MKKTLLMSGAALVLMGTMAAAQITVDANLGSSARLQWGSGSGPVHLGLGGVYWSGDPGNSMNDAGDALIGDGGANQNFGLVFAFDTTDAFRTAVANGAPVVLNGTSLYGVPDGFGGTTPKTVGDVNWGNMFVTLQGYGNSATGTLGDSNAFRTQAVGNLSGSDTLTNAVYQYTVGPDLVFAGNPYSADTTFSLDVTSLISGLGLSSGMDRVYIGLFARADGDGAGNGFVPSDFDGAGDRIAFYSSSLQLAVVPEPSTYAAIFGVLALAVMVVRRRLRK